MLQVCSLLAVFRHHAKLTGDLAFYLTKNQASLEAALPEQCAILCDNFASFSVAVFPEMFHIKDQKKLSRSTAI
ncbi:hypothetical protein KSC_004730 [Ktedonobacter sp. SOSP1-52]|uniref:hypothetical protein n=1 Tax=Ktedonobacter sp. SOSP1-52 TaxID=2778366 RepID=UPI00191608DD|nr:hypothetical protein [Ktedonobacter sp. SOSP1-52]GHO61581.1 hypothetical protein KSC_004730 [Ktedonobacter sp. SOSP1-52]